MNFREYHHTTFTFLIHINCIRYFETSVRNISKPWLYVRIQLTDLMKVFTAGICSKFSVVKQFLLHLERWKNRSVEGSK